MEILKEVLTVLKKKFELNLDKYQFLKKKIEYLGYIISNEGIIASGTRRQFSDFPVPKNEHEI